MRWKQTILLGALAIVALAAGLHAEEPTAEAVPKISLPKGKTCVGTLRMSGKVYKLEQIAAYPIRLYDNDATVVQLSDHPIAIDKIKAALRDGKGNDDGFSIFQTNAKITFDHKGKAIFCSAWAENRSISVNGGDNLKGNLTIKDGRVRGSATLTYGDKADQKEGFDASFDVPLLVKPNPKAASKPAVADKPPGDAGGDAAAKAGAVVRVMDVPIPKDATDVECTKLVGQIAFKSKLDVKKLCAALAVKFKEQGWKTDDDDLITPASSILKRTKGSAELTIFVKPEGAGSKVTIMTEGLDWGDDEAADDE